MAPNPNPVHPPGAPMGRNQLALASFLLSLVFPVAVILNVLNGGIVQTVDSTTAALRTVGNVLDILGIPTLIAAIVTGHIALRQAKRYPPQQARRGVAITGLVLGYLSLVLFLVAVGLIIWLLIHPIRIHVIF